MKLSFITDEATQDFMEAVEFALLYHLDGLELRSVNDLPIDRIDRNSLIHWKSVLDSHGLKVPCLSGSFYKCAHDDAQAIAENLEKLERLAIAADILECPYIRSFAFFKNEQNPVSYEKIVPYFTEPVRILEQHNKILLLEADPSVNTTNHAQLFRLLSMIHHPRVKAIFDPGNDLYDPWKEVPYPDGYEAIAPYILHIHIKDALCPEGGEPYCVKPGTGAVNYPALLAALRRDGYHGYLSLETHYRKQTQLSEKLMRLPQGCAFSNGGMESSAESILALQKMLR